jgi:dihydropteroate synthase
MIDVLNPSIPVVMGILNLTPDSFYDGNKYTEEKNILQRVEQMLDEGADIIDIGAFSSRPGAEFVSYETERKRLIPHLKNIIKYFPDTIVSIDTYRHQIAIESIEEGASIINDISAGKLDKQMFQTIAKLQVPYIMMHMQGTPDTMQKNPVYDDVVQDIINFFIDKINNLKHLGFNKIIIDPGFGFGKSIKHNYEILKRLQEFKKLSYPVLVGISRKSMLYKLLNITPEQALNATSVAHTIALLNGAQILRVHDVKEAVQSIKIVNQIKLV